MTTTKRQRKMSYRSSVTVNFVYATKFCIDPPFFNGSCPRALSTAHHTSRKSQLARFPALPFFRPDIIKYIAPVTCYVTVIPYCQPAVSLANVHTSYQTHASFRCRPCFVLHTNKVNCGFDSIYWRGGSVHTSNQRL